jgi:isoamylase
VRETRRRRAGAMLATLLLTDGVPMLLGGDELGRSQQGNNNAYAVDGPLTWFDWSDPAMVEVVTAFAHLRSRRGSGRWAGEGRWRAPDGGEVDWDRPGPALAEWAGSRPLALAVNPIDDATTFHLLPGTWARALSSNDPRWVDLQSPVLVVPPWTVVGLAGPDQDDSTT